MGIFAKKTPNAEVTGIVRRAAEVVPSERQLNWQKIGFYAFCHFGMNTFTGKEWGDGTTPPETFNPTALDAEQWVKVIKEAGMKALILTCKHHDGFCLWPSAYTEYSVKNSPFRGGKGDVVKEVSDACKKYGLQFGVYLSPWDRHEPKYGMGEPYDEYYINQLRELLTDYGDIFCIWLDGACGEGKNGKVQKYDWQSYFAVMRELQPNAVINICGPDVRWIGNEAGVCRDSEWSVVPSWLATSEYVSDNSQKTDDPKFAKKHNSMTLDLGSRKAIADAKELIWYPAEVDTSIRPGWFYHESQDNRVKSVDKLYQIYMNSVCGNASLLLNIPPDKAGVIAKPDALALDALRRRIEREFPENVAETARVSATSEFSPDTEAQNVLSDGEAYWQCAADDENPELVLDFGKETEIDKLLLMEHIRTGQQIEKFTVYAEKRGKWKKIAKATIIGYKRVCCFKPVRTSRIKISITDYRMKATLEKIEAYRAKQL